MCLILLANKVLAHFPLVLIGNRDEFYARPSESMRWRSTAESILSGKDQQSGGTWFGISQTGKIALITNYREKKDPSLKRPSRGSLVWDYLKGFDRPLKYLTNIASLSTEFAGYNLIVGELGPENKAALYYHSNKTDKETPFAAGPGSIPPGFHGLSNASLDTPWPKVTYAKTVFEKILKVWPGQIDEVDLTACFDLLANRSPFPDESLPDTGFGLPWERILSPLFIQSEIYGTRAAYVMVMDRQGEVLVEERTFPDKQRHRFRFALQKFTPREARDEKMV